MSELRCRWWIWCIDGWQYSDSVPSRIDYAVRWFAYTSPIHVPIAAIVAAFVWWLE